MANNGWVNGYSPNMTNNGNPNTVYNTPQGAYGADPQPQAGGWGIPQPPAQYTPNSGMQKWDNTTVSPAANWDPQMPGYAPWVAPATQAVGAALPAMHTNGWDNLTQGTGGTTPPVVQPPTTPPTTPPVTPPGGPGTGGNNPPSTNGQPVPAGTLAGYGKEIYDNLTSGKGTLGQGLGVTSMRGYNSGNTAGGGNQYLSDLSGGMKGKILQFLDVISEPFIPGNLYYSGTEKLSMTNAITSVLSGLTGMPANSILNMATKAAAKLGVLGDDNFVSNFLIQRARDMAENKAANSEKAFDQKMMEDEMKQMAQNGVIPPPVNYHGTSSGHSFVDSWMTPQQAGMFANSQRNTDQDIETGAAWTKYMLSKRGTALK